MVSFVHLWLYFAGFKIVVELLHAPFLNYFNLCMVHASQKGGGDYPTNLFFYCWVIYIIVPLYRRKFCDAHIILVFVLLHLLDDVLKKNTKVKIFIQFLPSEQICAFWLWNTVFTNKCVFLMVSRAKYFYSKIFLKALFYHFKKLRFYSVHICVT